MKYFFLISLMLLSLASFSQQNDKKIQADSVTVGQVVINELLAINSTIITDDYGEYNDWIELYNTTSNTVSLDNVYLSDSYNNPLKWQFPAGTNIGSHAYVIVWADGDSAQVIGFHAPFKLSGSGEKAILSYANGYIIDSVRFGQQTADISWGRYPNGTGPFMFLTPTFAATNSPLSIAEKGKETFSIYPNPADFMITVNTGNDNFLSAGLYDATGQLVLQSSSNTIDVRIIPAGFYYLNIYTPKGIIAEKIIIRR
jgi:hypothetical protein